LLCSHSSLLHESASTEIYTLSLHDALPICMAEETIVVNSQLTTTENESKILIYPNPTDGLTNIYFDNTTDNQLVITSVSGQIIRSEEHTSELQSRENLVCRLLLEKKKDIYG